MTKTVEFENAVDDAVTEIFETKEELLEAIKYFGTQTIADLLRSFLHSYEEDDDSEALYRSKTIE